MKYKSLGELCAINMGQSPESSSYNEFGDGIPFFQGNADFGERYPITRIWCNMPKKIAKAEDILISVRAPIGALNYAREECCIGRGLAAITPDNEKVSSDFIFWLLKGKTRELNEKGTGSTFKSIGRKVLEEIQVPDIDFEVQNEYATNLEKIYAIITARQNQLLLLDTLIKARFVEMFGDPVLNPKRWVRKRFDQICENLNNRRIPITKTDRNAGIYPYYGASGIVDYVDGYIYDEDILLISEDGANLVMRSTPIAFSVSGKVWVNNHAHVVRFESYATQKFIEIYFSLIDISKSITGTAQPKLNQAKLNSMKFCIPPIELQNEFAAFVQQIDKLRFGGRKRLTKAKNTKNNHRNTITLERSTLYGK